MQRDAADAGEVEAAAAASEIGGRKLQNRVGGKGQGDLIASGAGMEVVESAADAADAAGAGAGAGTDDDLDFENLIASIDGGGDEDGGADATGGGSGGGGAAAAAAADVDAEEGDDGERYVEEQEQLSQKESPLDKVKPAERFLTIGLVGCVTPLSLSLSLSLSVTRSLCLIYLELSQSLSRCYPRSQRFAFSFRLTFYLSP
jgi:hypothetical protein